MKIGDLVLILDNSAYMQHVGDMGLITDVRDDSRFIYPYEVLVHGQQMRFSSHEIKLVQPDDGCGIMDV